MTAPAFSPEVVAGARAVYESAYPGNQWCEAEPDVQERFSQAFSAGLQALLPVSDGLFKAIAGEAAFHHPNAAHKTVGLMCFEAAINHITGGSAL